MRPTTSFALSMTACSCCTRRSSVSRSSPPTSAISTFSCSCCGRVACCSIGASTGPGGRCPEARSPPTPQYSTHGSHNASPGTRTTRATRTRSTPRHQNQVRGEEWEGAQIDASHGDVRVVRLDHEHGHAGGRADEADGAHDGDEDAVPDAVEADAVHQGQGDRYGDEDGAHLVQEG